ASSDVQLRAAAASHASLPDVTRSMLLKSNDVFVLAALSVNIACSVEERALCLELVNAHGIVRDASTSPVFDKVMGQPGPMHERVQGVLAKSSDVGVLRTLAARVDLTEALQLQLAGNAELIDVLALNSGLHPTAQDKLLTGEVTDFTLGGVVTEQVLASMVGSFVGVALGSFKHFLRTKEAQKVARLLASSAALDPRLIGKVATIGDEDTRVLIASRDALPLAWAQWLVETMPTPAILMALSRNAAVAGIFTQSFADAAITVCNGVDRLEMIGAGTLPKAVIRTLSSSIGDAEVQDVLTEFARWEGLLKTEPAEGDAEARKGKEHALLLRALRDRVYTLVQENAALSSKP
ncbi:hypothetical protein, partial [Xanthomonas euvesicatoria]|uniref:hypothetical protein n=1 Tax=Xanthomonas euvesicatoria TaxID=456327 RepID=UPI002405D8A9